MHQLLERYVTNVSMKARQADPTFLVHELEPDSLPARNMSTVRAERRTPKHRPNSACLFSANQTQWQAEVAIAKAKAGSAHACC